MNAVVCDRCGASVDGGLVGHYGSMTCLRNRGWYRISYPYYPYDVILQMLTKVGAPHEIVEMPGQKIIYAPRWVGEMFRERGVTHVELIGLAEEAIRHDLGSELAAWVDIGGDPVQYILDRRRANTLLGESPAIDLNIVPDGTSKP